VIDALAFGEVQRDTTGPLDQHGIAGLQVAALEQSVPSRQG
jgi:hypothetical protein